MDSQTQSGTPRAVGPSVNGWHGEYLDAEFARYRTDPSSVPPDLASFFRGFELGLGGGGGVATGSPVQALAEELIAAYRTSGHIGSNLDPLGRAPQSVPELETLKAKVTDADLAQVAEVELAGRPERLTLRELVDRLNAAYCGPIGTEFMHIPSPEERAWFTRQLEAPPAPPTAEQQIRVLDQLTGAEVFDKFFGKRYQGKKRFSLEGGESVIPLLRAFTQRAGELGAQEVIVGMAHRGRLSVLRNYLGKDLLQLLTEFEDSWADGESQSGGDVKYHRGYSGDQPLDGGGSVHLSMLNNPSHLESVNAVVMGKTRAKQDQIGDTERQRVVSLLIHGDAALAGQGVVAEGLTMSLLPGYFVGGTVHVVINNLVGFTTDPEESRSTRYCTDIAKMVDAPVLHVNGDEPEAVVRAACLAAEYRRKFRKDVFVDLVCFRRYGHNEQDEPAYTQPQLYALVREHPGAPETYRRRLIAQGVLTQEQAQAQIDAVQDAMDKAQSSVRQQPVNPVPPPGGGVWKGFVSKYNFETPATAVPADLVREVCAAMGRVPEGFHTHHKLVHLLQARAALPQHNRISHADAEMVAIGTLVLQGTPVRLTGQDSRRGTFTQRHAVLRDEVTNERYTSLNFIRPDQPAKFDVYDSPLSEYAVVGYEYGYSRGAPRSLVLWEAQFGDFCNTAQVMIDQWMAASESKWSRWAGLVLLLPHGYEGQGPEHSSARLERFLMLCADNNMEVVYPSTGAQMFHVLRRQALRNFRKPLIVMTPKKYLRIETSSVDELTTGAFQHVIDDAGVTKEKSSIKRVIYCTGKVYHELSDRRKAIGRGDVAIVRIEQLAPFHVGAVKAVDQQYPARAERVWVQEEPRNAGAYLFIADRFRQELGIELTYIGRPASATPATGSEYAHKKEQETILSAAIGPAPAATPTSNGSAKHAPEPVAAGGTDKGKARPGRGH